MPASIAEHRPPTATEAAAGRPAPPWTPAFWRHYAVLMRPYLLFVSGLTGVAGLALAPAVSWTELAVLVPVFFGAYGFGQALTDCFQTDTDALSSPYRPLVRGVVRRRDVLLVSLAGLVGSGIILAVFNPATVPLAGLCIVGLATYTPFKRRWWGGPFYNAWIVAVLLVIAYLAGGGRLAGLMRPEVVCAVGVAFFGYANFVLAGYFKDVSADRATGYETLPVRFGLRRSAVVSDVFAVLAVVGTVAGIATSAQGSIAPAVGFAGAGLVATVLAQVRLHRVRAEEEAHRAIAPVVHAYLLLLSALAAAARPGWSVALLGSYVAFVYVLRRRPMRAQI